VSVLWLEPSVISSWRDVRVFESLWLVLGDQFLIFFLEEKVLIFGQELVV